MTSDAELGDVSLFDGVSAAAAAVTDALSRDEHDGPRAAAAAAEAADSSYGPVVAATLWVYVGPCIFVVGLCGNALVLAVMSQRRMRGTSTCVYLQWMAVADICVLVSGMITEWVEALFDIVFKAS